MRRAGNHRNGSWFAPCYALSCVALLNPENVAVRLGRMDHELSAIGSVNLQHPVSARCPRQPLFQCRLHETVYPNNAICQALFFLFSGFYHTAHKSHKQKNKKNVGRKLWILYHDENKKWGGASPQSTAPGSGVTMPGNQGPKRISRASR